MQELLLERLTITTASGGASTASYAVNPPVVTAGTGAPTLVDSEKLYFQLQHCGDSFVFECPATERQNRAAIFKNTLNGLLQGTALGTFVGNNRVINDPNMSGAFSVPVGSSLGAGGAGGGDSGDSSGGMSAGTVFLLVAASLLVVGGMVWWLFFRRVRGGQNAAGETADEKGDGEEKGFEVIVPGGEQEAGDEHDEKVANGSGGGIEMEDVKLDDDQGKNGIF